MKKLLILLFAAACILPLAAENKAYRVLQEATLKILDEKGSVIEKLPQKVAKGDTVYATQQTYDFIKEFKGAGKHMIPVEYNGTNAFIDVNKIYPVRLESTDVLEYIDPHKLEPGSFKEQKMIPLMEWAMNVTENPMQWIYLALIAIVCAGAFRFVSTLKGFGIIGLTLVGISLGVMSVAEIMYFLCYEPHATWFLKSSIVGGWGHVILNFLILAAVCAAQAYFFYDLWNSSFAVGDRQTLSFRKKDEYDYDDDDYDDDKTPKWIVNAAYLPLIFGIALIVLVIFEASSTIYFLMGALLVVAALAGAIYQFSKGRIIPGIIFPVCYLLAAIGLTVLVMTLGVLLVLVAIVGAIFFLLIAFAISFVIGLTQDRVDFVDEDGKKHSGVRQSNGIVKADNGKYYKLRD